MTPPFVPYPPDSLRRQNSSKGNSETRLPFTQVFLAAMKFGYTRRDLAAMPYGEVIFDLAAMNEESGKDDGAKVEMASQEDIRNMLG